LTLTFDLRASAVLGVVLSLGRVFTVCLNKWLQREHFTFAVQCLRRSSSACSFYQVNLLKINVRL